MSPDLIRAGVHLADLLNAENSALSTFDLVSASALFDAKQAAAESFADLVGLHAEAEDGPADAARAVASRLRDLAEENRRLLERAITVQNRVISTVAQAAASSTQSAPRYGRSGTISPDGHGRALTSQV